jgi:GTP pyrophosphokinase
VDLAWDTKSKGGTARLAGDRQEPARCTRRRDANIFGVNKANILNLQLVNREGPFHTDIIDHRSGRCAPHLMRIISALRALDFVAQADRV